LSNVTAGFSSFPELVIAFVFVAATALFESDDELPQPVVMKAAASKASEIKPDVFMTASLLYDELCGSEAVSDWVISTSQDGLDVFERRQRSESQPKATAVPNGPGFA
jgi:hypothetical protein